MIFINIILNMFNLYLTVFYKIKVNFSQNKIKIVDILNFVKKTYFAESQVSSKLLLLILNFIILK